jgi:hypothetical protein
MSNFTMPQCFDAHKVDYRITCKDELLAFEAENLKLPQDVQVCLSNSFKDCPPDKKQTYKEALCPSLKKSIDCLIRISTSCNDDEKNLVKSEREKECGEFTRSQGFTTMMPWTLFLLFFV